MLQYLNVCRTPLRKLSIITLSACLIIQSANVYSEPHQHSLPSLGEQSGSLVATDQEYKLGRAWLRALRSQTKTINDPLVHDYLEHLVYKLGSHSNLTDLRLEVTVVDNETINAFAVPGGIIGVNAGLFLYSESEDEFASVIAHEIAHLSQRHFARGLEASQTQGPASVAAIFAGILLMAASGNPDAGIALVMGSQAASIQSQLRFSRDREREADRVGLQIMADAGLNPQGMPQMFKRMYMANRYNSIPAELEFLLTHPMTEARLADTGNRAEQYDQKALKESLDYQLIRQRIQLHYEEDFESYRSSVGKKLRTVLSNNIAAAYKYGIAYSYFKDKKYTQALKGLQALLQKSPENITYLTTQAEIQLAMGQTDVAAKNLAQHLKRNPSNYPLSMMYAKALNKLGQYSELEKLLKKLVLKTPNRPPVWEALAQARTHLNKKASTHEAKAEYFFYIGDNDLALKHLDDALKMASSHQDLSRIRIRIKQIHSSRDDMRI